MSVRTIQLVLEATDRGATRQIQQVRGGVQGLGTDLGSIAGAAVRAAGTLGLAFGAREVIDWLLETNRQTERLMAQLETVEGSRAGALSVFRAMEELAGRTPFQIEELVDAYVRLGNQGIRPTERMLISFGDTTSAQQKSLEQWVEAVNDAMVFEFERLKEFGIKVGTQGDQLTVRFRGQTRTIRKDGQAIIDLLTEIGETEFAGAMERQMKTIDGAISNLQDNLSTISRTIGQEGGVNAEVRDAIIVLRDFTARIAANKEQIRLWTRVSIESAQFVGNLVGSIVRVAVNLSDSVVAISVLVVEGFKIQANAAARFINWLIEQVNRIPGVNIDFRFGQFETTEFRHVLSAVFDTIRGEAGQTKSALGDLMRSWLDIASAAGTAGDAQAGAAGAGAAALGGDSGGGGGRPRPRGATFGLNRDAAVRAVFDETFGIAKATPDFSGGLFGRPRPSPFSVEAAREQLFPGSAAPFIEQQLEGLRLTREAEAAFLEAHISTMERARLENAAFAESVRQDLLLGLTSTFQLLGPALLGGLGGFDEGLKAIGGSVAGTLGDMMINAGTTIVLTSSAFEKFRAGLLSLVPGAGIGAGLALIAAGAALKHAVGSFTSSPTGGGGGSSTSASGGLGGVRDLRGGGTRIVNVHLPEGGILNLNDFRQREAFKRMIREVGGTGEVRFVGSPTARRRG